MTENMGYLPVLLPLLPFTSIIIAKAVFVVLVLSVLLVFATVMPSPEGKKSSINSKYKALDLRGPQNIE